MKPKTQTLSKSKDAAKRPLHRLVVLLACDDCGKRRSRWKVGPGIDNDGQKRERCNCRCGGTWVSHWAHVIPLKQHNDQAQRLERVVRLRAQKRRWYHENKEWSNPKRNESRRERFKIDPAYRAKRLAQGIKRNTKIKQPNDEGQRRVNR